MPALAVNKDAKASVEFDITRPLRFSRSGVCDDRNSPIAFIYSQSVDGCNNIAVARVRIGLGVGLSDEQERALVDRIADEIVAPGFSDEEIEYLAGEMYSAPVGSMDDARARAKRLLGDMTTRRRLNLSGSR